MLDLSRVHTIATQVERSSYNVQSEQDITMKSIGAVLSAVHYRDSVRFTTFKDGLSGLTSS